MRDYQNMRLEEIIIGNKGGVKATQNALKLLSIILEEHNKDMIKNILIKNENVFKQIEIYKNQIYD